MPVQFATNRCWAFAAQDLHMHRGLDVAKEEFDMPSATIAFREI